MIIQKDSCILYLKVIKRQISKKIVVYFPQYTILKNTWNSPQSLFSTWYCGVYLTRIVRFKPVLSRTETSRTLINVDCHKYSELNNKTGKQNHSLDLIILIYYINNFYKYFLFNSIICIYMRTLLFKITNQKLEYLCGFKTVPNQIGNAFLGQ